MGKINDQIICCPEFNPEIWNEKTHVWQDKLFMKDSVAQFMHMPLNMGKIITKMYSEIQKAGAAPSNEEFLMLCYDPSPWKSEINITVTKEVPGANNIKISGTFLSKTFDGPYNAVPKWMKEMEDYAKKNNKEIIKQYVHYAYCPKCAKKYGHNWAIVFAEIK